MRIGFITYDALPYTSNWGGSQRIHYMANQLAQTNDVKIWSSKNTNKEDYRSKKIHYQVEQFDNNLHTKFIGVNSSDEQHINKRNIKRTILSYIKKTVVCINHIFYNEPNPSMSLIGHNWIRSNRAKIYDSILEWKPDVLIISIPPWSILLTGLISDLKRQGIKIIIDFRDPWNCWNGGSLFTRRKERQIIKLADYIFTATPTHRDKLISSYNINGNKIKVIMNGFDAELWNTIKIPNNDTKSRLTISYIGAISFNTEKNFRNPGNLLIALSKCQFADLIDLRIVGYYDSTELEKAKSIFPNITMIGKVSQEESFRYMLKSDILMNLHTTNDNSSIYLIAGKIYDYYRSGKKILSINNPESFEQMFIKNNGLGYTTINSVPEIISALNQIFHDWNNNCLKSDNKINEFYSRQEQNKLVEDFIKEISEVDK